MGRGASLISNRLKPLARARRGPALRERVAGPLLTRALEEELFRLAEVLSEGGCRASSGPAESYFGSSMISIDLDRLRPWFRHELNATALDRLMRALDGSVRVRLRAMRLARAEAVRRVPHRLLGTAYVETRVRLTDRQLHIDVDLEAALSVFSGAGGS
jgi:hypothetical protein